MAPRCKMATRIFLRGLGASAAYSARESQAGAVLVPYMARAEDFKNKRRENILLSPLKIRRSNHHSRGQRASGAIHAHSFSDRVQRLLRRVGKQYLPRHGGGDSRKLRGIYAH